MRTRYLGGAALALLVLPVAAGAALERTAPLARADDAYYRLALGSRELRLGDRGADVKTLNWALRAQALDAPFLDSFTRDTDAAVRALQRSAGLTADGVVGRLTMKAIAVRMPHLRATWYGPGLWGRRTACGVKLERGTVGIAHRKLPCGTRVTLAYRGRWRRARVIDRGPYRKGYGLDLTRTLAARLGVVAAGTGKVKIGVAG
jgi:rare lipoprotein A (peptidoglycan hydrolase)